MHVLIIYTGEFQTNGPSGGIFQLHQAKVLKNGNIKVGILNPNLISPRYLFKSYKTIKNRIFDEIPVFRSYKRNIFPKKISFLNYFLKSRYEKITLELFNEYIKHHGKPDICHVFDIRFGLVAGNIIKEKFNIPYIFTEYCVETANNTLTLSKNYIENIVKPALNNANRIVLPSKKFSKKFKRYLNYKRKIDILAPVLPPDLKKKKLNTKPKKNNSNFKFIMVCRLDKNKNVEIPIKAFLRLKFVNSSLTIIGDGPEFKYLKQYEFEKKITFLRNVPRKKMLDLLSKSDCIICSSFNETFGVGLIEASNYGLPIISSNCEGPSDIVNKNNGILVFKNDVKSFSSAMNFMISKKHKFKKKKIMRENEKKFGNINYLKKFRKLSNIILNE